MSPHAILSRLAAAKPVPDDRHHRIWRAALDELPVGIATHWDVDGGIVRVHPAGDEDRPNLNRLRQTLMRFHPWRKGPFEVLGVSIDSEWRSDTKWNRVAPWVDLKDAVVLDVGCGNGYYGWRMLDSGAASVAGIDPTPLYGHQYKIFERLLGEDPRHGWFPLGDQDLPADLAAFDVVCSMGVLYHRPNPIGHLTTLRGSLRPGGQLVLETLVIDGNDQGVLVPEGRYAQMRNVWFIPTPDLLARWLRRIRFTDVHIRDVTLTGVEEQRSTDWMTFHSLKDFLDPNDSSRTVEGHPAPRRAILTATRPSS